MRTYKLEDIRAAAEAKFESFIIEVGDDTFEYKNLLNVSDEVRGQVQKLLSSLDDENTGVDEAIASVFALVAATKEAAELIEMLSTAEKVVLIEMYAKQSQAGEQLPSAE